MKTIFTTIITTTTTKRQFRNNIILTRSLNTLPPFKTAFFGTDEHSNHVLKRLIEAPHLCTNLAVVCPPEDSPVFRLAAKAGLDVIRAPPKSSLKQNPLAWAPVVDFLTHKQCELAVVYSFGYFIPSSVLTYFQSPGKQGAINLHPSLLPRYRGPNPIQHAVYNGDTHTAVSVIEVHPHHFDAGDILAQRIVPIHATITNSDLAVDLGRIGADLMLDVIADLDNLRTASRNKVMDETVQVSYARKFVAADKVIDFETVTARQAYNRWRAFGSELSTNLLQVPHSPHVLLEQCEEPIVCENDDTKIPPGFARLSKSKTRLLIKCQDDNAWLPVVKLKVEGRRSCDAMAFANGFLKTNKTVGGLIFGKKHA